MAKAIELTVKVPVKEIKSLLEFGGFEINNKAKFDKIIESASFKRKLAKQILSDFMYLNEDGTDGACDVCEQLFGDPEKPNAAIKYYGEDD